MFKQLVARQTSSSIINPVYYYTMNDLSFDANTLVIKRNTKQKLPHCPNITKNQQENLRIEAESIPLTHKYKTTHFPCLAL